MSTYSGTTRLGNQLDHTTATQEDHEPWASTLVGPLVPAEKAVKAALQIAAGARVTLMLSIQSGQRSAQNFTHREATIATNQLMRVYAVNTILNQRSDTGEFALLPDYKKFFGYMVEIEGMKPKLLELDPTLGQAISDRQALAYDALVSGNLDSPLIPDGVKDRVIEEAKTGQAAVYLGTYAQEQIKFKYIDSGKDPVKTGSGMGTGVIIAAIAAAGVLYFTTR